MATYRLKIKRDNTQIQIIAKSGGLVAYEMDRYLEDFVNRKINSDLSFLKKDKSNYSTASSDYVFNNSLSAVSNFNTNNTQHTEIVNEQAYPKTQYEQNTNQITIAQETANPNANRENSAEFCAEKHAQEHMPEKREQQVPVSLGNFLASNKANDIFNQFIITTYYVKRVLNIPHFTLKMINAKFYPATNSLVDLSIINEARTRGFIESFEEDGVAKYALTPAGESYFINQLRG